MSNLLDRINERTQLAGHNRLALLLFTLGENATFGINVFKVLEVIRRPPLFHVPGLHKPFQGIADFRGRSVPILDFSEMAGFPMAESQPLDYIIITEFNQSIQGFLVSSVERIVNVDVNQINPPPGQITGDGGGWITGLIRINQKLVQILDVETILAQARGQPSISHQQIQHLGVLPSKRDGTPHRIIVVDDSRAAQSQIRQVVEKLGAVMTAFSDGQAAHEHLLALVNQGVSPADHYTLMISDVEMPSMDGYTLTRLIRDNPKLQSLYIILHSSLTGAFHKARVDQVDADAVVAKYSPEALGQKIVEGVDRVMHR